MRKYLEGTTADIWQLIYDRLDQLPHKPIAVKIKSHVDELHLRHNVYPTAWLLANEAADVAANVFADHRGYRDIKLRKDREARFLHSYVCKRLSAIELHIREN